MKPIISREYATLNKRLHEERFDYGASATEWVPHIVDLARRNDSKVIFDYGCGKGTLKTGIAKVAPEFTVLEFDPAIEGKDKIPSGKPDLLVALDVMEHIEPDYLNAVLATMRRIRPQAVFLSIATMAANKTLPDGRNAHIIVQPPEWWIEQLEPHFQQIHAQVNKGHFIYIGRPLP